MKWTFIHKFRSDGCTLFPDGVWGGCCRNHDLSYHRGGTFKERREVDLDLQHCVFCALTAALIVRYAGAFPLVIKATAFALSWVMYVGVRIFGTPWLPTGWRWGFGHRYPWHWPEEPRWTRK